VKKREACSGAIRPLFKVVSRLLKLLNSCSLIIRR
jgi:hypothetical protein